MIDLLAQAAPSATDTNGWAQVIATVLGVGGVLGWFTKVLIPRLMDEAKAEREANATRDAAQTAAFTASLERLHHDCREERREITDAFRAELAATRESFGGLASTIRHLAERLQQPGEPG